MRRIYGSWDGNGLGECKPYNPYCSLEEKGKSKVVDERNAWGKDIEENVFGERDEPLLQFEPFFTFRINQSIQSWYLF